MPPRMPRDQNQDFSDIVGDYRDLGSFGTDVAAMGNDLGGEVHWPFQGLVADHGP